MVGPNTRSRKYWSSDEDLRLILGINQYWESLNVYAEIIEDESLRFRGYRTNIDLKDRFRFLYPNLVPYRSFFVPRNCNNPRAYIPDIYWIVLDQEDIQQGDHIQETENYLTLREILYKYSTVIEKFLILYESLPINLERDPLKTSKTWKHVCNCCFSARNRLSVEQMDTLLIEMIQNAHLKHIKVGIRTYVYRAA